MRLHPSAGHRSEHTQSFHHFLFFCFSQWHHVVLGIGIVPKPITICYYMCVVLTKCCSIVCMIRHSFISTMTLITCRTIEVFNTSMCRTHAHVFTNSRQYFIHFQINDTFYTMLSPILYVEDLPVSSQSQKFHSIIT